VFLVLLFPGVAYSQWITTSDCYNGASNANAFYMMDAADLTGQGAVSGVVTGATFGPWYLFERQPYQVNPNAFVLCSKGPQAALIPSSERIYLTGKMPPDVYQTGLTVNDNGLIYRVFTSETLKNYGLGYIIRWGVRSYKTPSNML